jgi:hypothetical protein
MGKTAQEWANLFGATIVGQVPDVGGAPFGMARLAHFMHERLTPSQGDRPGRPSDPTWESRPKVPMSQNTHRRLVEIARRLSTPDRQVSPMQVAAQLLEMARSGLGDGKVSLERLESEEQNGMTPVEPRRDTSEGRGAARGRRKGKKQRGSPPQG